MTVLFFGGSGRLGMAVQSIPNSLVNIVPYSKYTDITDENDVRYAIRDAVSSFGEVDVVVNAAALTNLSKCEIYPEMAHDVNAKGAGIVARVAQELDIPSVYISTDYVFGGGKAPYGVDDPTCPVCEYGRSKAEGERASLAFGSKVLRMAFFPFPQTYDPVRLLRKYPAGVEALRTKEFLDQAAVRLHRFIEERDYLRCPDIVHLVSDRETTILTLLREITPHVDLWPRSAALESIPYPFPWDTRLTGAW